MLSRTRLKWLAGAAGALLGVAGLLYGLVGERPATVEAESIQQAEPTDSTGAAPLDPPSGIPSNAAGEAPLWRAVDEGSVSRKPYFADEWSPEGRALVRVAGAAAAAQAWQVGDRLTISLPQTGETLRPVIDEIDDGPGQSRAASGTVLDEHGHPRRIVVTVGPTSMFAWIDTPDGVYELFADSDYGWLLPAASLMAGFDFSEPDYVLPQDGAQLVPAPSAAPNDPGS